MKSACSSLAAEACRRSSRSKWLEWAARRTRRGLRKVADGLLAFHALDFDRLTVVEPRPGTYRELVPFLLT